MSAKTHRSVHVRRSNTRPRCRSARPRDRGRPISRGTSNTRRCRIGRCERLAERPQRATLTNTRWLRMSAQSIGVVANPVAFWGQRPWFESRMDYSRGPRPRCRSTHRQRRPAVWRPLRFRLEQYTRHVVRFPLENKGSQHRFTSLRRAARRAPGRRRRCHRRPRRVRDRRYRTPHARGLRRTCAPIRGRRPGRTTCVLPPP